MQIPDFPMKDPSGPSFVSHKVIRQYLWDYAEHFNLYSHIKVLVKITNTTKTTIPSVVKSILIVIIIFLTSSN